MTKRRNKRASFALFAVLMLFLTGCSGQYYGGIAERTDGLEDAYTEDILPESQNTSYGSKVSATLYFRYLSEDLLAGVEQEFTVTAENTIEELVGAGADRRPAGYAVSVQCADQPGYGTGVRQGAERLSFRDAF